MGLTTAVTVVSLTYISHYNFSLTYFSIYFLIIFFTEAEVSVIAKLSDIVILMHPKNPISSNPIKSGKTDRNLNVKLEMVSLIEVVGWKFSFALEKSNVKKCF